MTSIPEDLAGALASASMFAQAAEAPLDDDEASAWAAFETWCRRTGESPLPAAAQTVSAWLSGLGDVPSAAGADAIGAMHLRAGFDDPAGDPA